jgi:hypothetical protein
VVQDQARERTGPAWHVEECRECALAARDEDLDRHHGTPTIRLGVVRGVSVRDQDETLEAVEQRRHPGAHGAKLGALAPSVQVTRVRGRVGEAALPAHVGPVAPGVGLGEDSPVWEAEADADGRGLPSGGEDVGGMAGLGVVVRALDEHGVPQAGRRRGSGSGK